jgi:SAM-dependent methyltransferase
MERIRKKNINTKEEFDELFVKDFGIYDSYKNIKFYDSALNLGLFRGGSYLDYGCGNGNALNGLAVENPGVKCKGVDISEFVIDKNKKLFSNIDFYTLDEFWKNQIMTDHILSSHTFEHLEDPGKIAEKLLKRAGKTFTIIVPYKDSWKECEQHVWKYYKTSFDYLQPTMVKIGLTNKAGNTEIIYHWDKQKTNHVGILFCLKKIPRENYIGLIKIIFKKLEII